MLILIRDPLNLPPVLTAPLIGAGFDFLGGSLTDTGRICF
jgi:hypothetical protein